MRVFNKNPDIDWVPCFKRGRYSMFNVIVLLGTASCQRVEPLAIF